MAVEPLYGVVEQVGGLVGSSVWEIPSFLLVQAGRSFPWPFVPAGSDNRYIRLGFGALPVGMMVGDQFGVAVLF